MLSSKSIKAKDTILSSLSSKFFSVITPPMISMSSSNLFLQTGVTATGVPGSFYSRLFPKAFLHFAYSSYALQCLSKVPEEVVDMNSPSWNKGRIHYSKSADQVVKAYTTQYAKDMECFLNARAQEIVRGGLMAFVVPGRPNGIPHTEVFVNTATELFGS
ncbi:hypothetical protein CerSpe_168090 [Prunus speciosa]